MFTNLHCEGNVLLVSWDSSAGASRYTVLGQVEDQPPVSCSSMDTFCQLSPLECGDVYNITVLAGDGTCNSSSKLHAVIETGRATPFTVMQTGRKRDIIQQNSDKQTDIIPVVM